MSNRDGFDETPTDDSFEQSSRRSGALRLVEPVKPVERDDGEEEVEDVDLVDEPQELNLRLLLPFMRYVRNEYGQNKLDELITRCGLPASALRRSAPWISHRRFEMIMAAVRELVPNDQEFMRAATYDLKRVYGPMLLVLRCVSISTLYQTMARTSHLATRVSKFEVVHRTRTSVRLRYTSQRPDSRLNCLARQAVQRHNVRLWSGRGSAMLEERACIARGDDACIYDIKWYEPLGWRTPLAGLATGAGAAAALSVPFLMPAVAYGALSTIGLLGGLFLGQRRALRDHEAFANETTRELERLVQAHARAVDEVLALHEREQQWTARLETSIADRTAKVGRVVEKLEAIGSVRKDKLRTISHDINNPLTVLAATVASLRESQALVDPEDVESVEAIESSVDRMTRLVGELVDILREDPSAEEMPVEPVDVDDLTRRMRRQLRATVMSRDIRVTVFQTREAPKVVQSYPLVLERVVDNLLTNACKYTERGSIVVEVSGRPGMLLLKISDTGRGIGPERLEQVFLAGRPDPNPMTGRSHGAGMGIVVRLLDQLAGRLEIMSDPGTGTTLWVHVPVELRRDISPAEEPVENLAGIIKRVVTIRQPNP